MGSRSRTLPLARTIPAWAARTVSVRQLATDRSTANCLTNRLRASLRAPVDAGSRVGMARRDVPAARCRQVASSGGRCCMTWRDQGKRLGTCEPLPRVSSLSSRKPFLEALTHPVQWGFAPGFAEGALGNGGGYGRDQRVSKPQFPNPMWVDALGGSTHCARGRWRAYTCAGAPG